MLKQVMLKQVIDLKKDDWFLLERALWVVRDSQRLADNVSIQITDTSGEICVLPQFDTVSVVWPNQAEAVE